MTTPNITRRNIALGLGLSLLPLKLISANVPKPSIEIWKSATCGCCHDWMNHMTTNGFVIGKVHDVGNDAARKKFGINNEFGSCHTALIDGYVFEGHVPAKDVERVLREKPHIVGLAVPGMPIGSPGMDGPEYKGRRDPYSVIAIQKNGQAKVYRRYS